MVVKKQYRKIILFLFRNFSLNHTISSISQKLGLSRVGIWKILKRLEEKNLVRLTSIDQSKTNPLIVSLNWDNILLEKLLSLYLTDDAIKEKKWYQKLQGLRMIVDFLIIYIPKDESQKVTIISIIPSNKIKIYHTPGELGNEREIHTINLTEPEFTQEFIKADINFINQVNNGKVLFGQEKFIQNIKQVQMKNL